MCVLSPKLPAMFISHIGVTIIILIVPAVTASSITAVTFLMTALPPRPLLRLHLTMSRGDGKREGKRYVDGERHRVALLLRRPVLQR